MGQVRPELANEIFLDLDPMTGMKVGGPPWKPQLVQKEFASEIVVCLLSEAWLASGECIAEFRNAQAWDKQIVVARLQNLGGTDLTFEMQRCDLFTDGLDEEAVEQIAVPADPPTIPGGPPVRFSKAALRQIQEAIQGRGIGPENFAWPVSDDPKRAPYRGWEPFEDIDAGVFFGRDAAIARGLQALRDMRRWPSRQKALFVVLSPSGSGKSSFLRAGLIPRLQRDDRNFLVLGVMRPESRALTGDRGFAAAIDSARQALQLPGRPLGDIQADVEEACRLDDADRIYDLFYELLMQVRETRARRLADEAATEQTSSDVERANSPPTLLLPLDQAEELFPVRGPAQLADGEAPRTEAELFLTVLAKLFGTINATEIGLIVAAGIRTDRYEKMQNHPAVRGIGKVVDELTPMPPAQFELVITGPSRRETEDAGRRLTVDPALVAELVTDAKGADTLPLLALTLERLYTKYASTGQLTLANYRSKAVGGMRQVVNNEIEQILTRDPQERETALRRLRAAFIPNLVDITDSGRFVRRRARESDLPADSGPLIDALVEKRLLVRDTERDGTVVIEVALESLFDHWDALGRWLNEQTEDLKTVADIKRSAAGWRAHDQDPPWLLKGTRLANAEKLAATSQFSSRIADDSDFLAASRGAEEKTAATERRRRRRLTAALVATAIVAVIAVVGAVVAVVERSHAIRAQHQATREARDALAAQLDTEASAVFSEVTADSDIRALADTLAAQRLRTDPAASRGAFYTATAALNTTRIIVPTRAAVGSVAVSPDGHTLASGGADYTVRLWNPTNPAHSGPLGGPLTGHTNAVNSVAFSPDGHTLASGSADHTVRLWDLTDPAHPGPLGGSLTGHTNSVDSVAFSPDGHTLAAGSADHTVRLWNLTDPAHPGPLGESLTGPTDIVDQSVAFSPDGHTLAAGSADHTVRLWDLTDPAHPGPLGAPLTGPTNWVARVAFSPDGHTLAAGSRDGTVRLWNLTDPAHPGQSLTGHADDVARWRSAPTGTPWPPAAAMTPCGCGTSLTRPTRRRWASPCGATPTRWSAWRSALTGTRWPPAAAIPRCGCGTSTAPSLHGPTGPHQRGDQSVAFSPDGHTLASGSGDDTVRLWNVTDPAHPGPLGRPLTGHTGTVTSVAFSPDGHTLAAGSADDTVRLWNVTDPAHPSPLGQPLTGHTSAVNSVAFSPDGHTLAAGSADHTVRLWNVTDPAHPGPLGHPDRPHQHVARWRSARTGTPWPPAAPITPCGCGIITDPAHPSPSHPDRPHQHRRSVAFSPDGHTLAAGSADHTVRLWNLTDPAHPSPLGGPLTGHTGAVFSVAFSSRRAHPGLVGSGDGTVRLWGLTDPAHPGPLGEPLQGDTGAVFSVAFSPDGHTLASGSNDDTIRLWPTPLDATVVTLCSKLHIEH